MKKTLILLMFLYSCNQTNQQNSDPKREILTDVERFIPNNLVSDQNFMISVEMENQINLYKYILTKYKSDFRNFHIEKFYTSKLLFSGQNSLLIDEIYIKNDGSQDRTPYEYTFYDNGKLKKVSQLDDPNYSMNFLYGIDYQLRHVVYNKLFTPWTETSGHDVITRSPVKESEELIFSYKNGLLNSDTYSSSSPTVNIQDNGAYQYFRDNSDTNIKYIKYIRNLNFRASQEFLYCFNGDKLKFITYKEGTIANPTPLLLREVYLWSQYSNNIKILEYELNFDTNKQEIKYRYNIEMGSSIKINKIEGISSWRATEDYYQYRFQDNNIIGYEIFRADLDIKKDLDNQKRDYKLTKAFLMNQ